MIRIIRTASRMALLGAVVLIAALAGAAPLALVGTGPSALAGTAPPAHAVACGQQQWIQAEPYQFASNPGGLPTNGSGLPVINWWQVSNSPFNGNTSSQSLGNNGVDLSITPSSIPPDQGFASSGIVVPLGTVASSKLLNTGQGGGLNPLPYSGSSNLQTSIIFDTNGDFDANGAPYYFDFNGDTLAGYGTPPDQIATDAASGVSSNSLATDENASLGNNTPIWAWINLANGSAGNTTGNVLSVNRKPLTELSAAPVTGLAATAKYTNLTATWQPSCGATKYRVTVTTHSGSVTVAKATVTGTSHRFGGLKENTRYAVHVLAKPAAPSQQPTTVHVTTK